ncbi:MAG: hypothetical protein KAY24_02590 [Candidatus Eisenbacteria sp.]|nr:hypothetical protein [Candidatus Eisenbacteria bacterium]
MLLRTASWREDSSYPSARRPHIPACGQYSDRKWEEYASRDQNILDSFRSEYEARLVAEEPSVEAALDDPEEKVAHVVYNTG